MGCLLLDPNFANHYSNIQRAESLKYCHCVKRHSKGQNATVAYDGRQGFEKDFSDILDLTAHTTASVSSCMSSTLFN